MTICYIQICGSLVILVLSFWILSIIFGYIYDYFDKRNIKSILTKTYFNESCQLETLIKEKKYQEAYELCDHLNIIKYSFLLEPDQYIKILEMEIECYINLEKYNKAIKTMGCGYLFHYKKFDNIPEKRLSEWLKLYKLAGTFPINIFFCYPEGGVDQDILQLIRYAIDKGCTPPDEYNDE